MTDLAVAVVLGLLGVLAALWYQYRRKVFNTFKELNIPGPEPHFLYGNLREFFQMGPNKAHKEWTKKYGKVFGYYFGAYPLIVIGDTELLKQIQIKDFQNFINRPELIPGGSNTGKLFNHHVIRQRDQEWKNQRAILTPSFTSGKMKQMVPIMNDALEEFMGHVGVHSDAGREFEIYSMYQALTLDVISRTAFGIRSNVQSNTNDDFLLAVQDAIREDSLSGVALYITCLPELASILYPFRLLAAYLRSWSGKSRLEELEERCKAIVKSRRVDPKNRRNDLLQLMLDAEMSHSDINKLSSDAFTAGLESEVKKSETPKTKQESQTSGKKSYFMNDDEVVSNTFIVLLAGFDTTSTALGFTTHVLVNNEDIQEKIRQEVKDVFNTDGILDFTNVSQCKYLEQVFMESLRYYPPVAGFVTRETGADITYGTLRIPKGTGIQVPLSLNRDPDYWTDPDTFNPDRFSAENKGSINPMAFQSFGAGPRNCIGMRFAQMEAKLALANLLLKYRLVPGEHTELGDIEVVYKLVLMNPKNGVFVKAERIQD